MADEVINLIETHLTTRDLTGNMTVLAPDGSVIDAPIVAWMFGLMTLLTDTQKAQLCRVVQHLPQGPLAPNHLIDAPAGVGTPVIHSF